jgi:predicted TPR repeat methyltransferase
MGILMNTLKLFSKPVEFAKQAIATKKTVKEYIAQLQQEIQRQRQALKNLRQTNYNLGLTHYYKGNYYDARLRFNMLKWFKAETPELKYFIARCYYEEGKGAEAKPYLESYLATENPQFKAEAEYTNKIIDGKTSDISEIPNSLVAHFYDLLSPVYNEVFIDSKPDNVQQKLFSNVNRLLTEKARPFGNKVLDLGCGTGIIGKFCRQNRIASFITGVDLSPLMLEQAKKLKSDDFAVYNEVSKSSVADYLGGLSQDKKFDIIFASNLFISCSDVSNTLSKSYEHAEDKAIFAFTVKTHNGAEERIFDSKHEEFKFNKEYILRIVAEKWKIIYQEDTTFVDAEAGMVIILQKVS